MLFTVFHYYPSGPPEDFSSYHDTLVAARTKGDLALRHGSADDYHVLDLDTGEFVVAYEDGLKSDSGAPRYRVE